MQQIQPLFDRKLQCPVCSHNFTSKKVRSKFIKIKDYDTDFCPNYKEGSVFGLLYNIFVCPNCGYAYSDDFSKYFPPNAKETIEEKITAKWKPHDFGGEREMADAIQTYKLATVSATIKKEKHVILAGLYIRIGWLYRYLKDENQEKRFLKLSVREYADSYSTEDFKGTQVSEVRVLYLLGELSQRIGNIDQATKYLSMVIERQKSTIETNLIELAKESWQRIRDYKSREA